MSRLVAELRSTPLSVLLELFEENVAEYNDLRERGVALESEEFEENSTMFLLYRKALEERGVSEDEVAALEADGVSDGTSSSPGAVSPSTS
ncbi:hypothetical protein ACFSBZ_04625 [Amnibacterium flavum]|uniref:Uncharacterized protein n=1 Tax=Amnibacterium flavum TaxID=2173173 RepID=A0A2V1HRE9_9MICO|nr:hypothetical protein [Amnibacterium flavum]PVZ94232.1 hypothetical protein DDQ50_10845 [Amnibacterium flavum]